MARRKNVSTMPLHQSILSEFRDGLLAAQFEDESSQTLFVQYQDDPAGFGRDILKETFTDDVIAVMESVRDYPITIARSANAVGKTHGAARVAAWFYKCHRGAQVYTTAAPPEDNLRRLLWGEIGSVVENHPHVFSDDVRKLQSMKIARASNEFLVGVSIPVTGTEKQREARFSGKHAPYILFIIDEGDAVPPETYKGIESCMSGGHARLLIMFNPRTEAGYTFQLEHQKSANIVELSAFNHPNVITGKNVIPGAVTQETTVRRISQWTRPLYMGERKDASCFEVPDFLVGVRALDGSGQLLPPLPGGWRKVVEPQFSYMVLGKYPEMSENQLINRTWVDAAMERWKEFTRRNNNENPPMGYLPMMGVDVADLGGDLNVCTLRFDHFVARPFVWAGVDPSVTADEASRIYAFNRCVGAWVDSNGVGAAVPALMRKEKCTAYRIMTSASPTQRVEEGEFGRVRDQGWWFVREWLRNNPLAMLPPDDELREELLAMTYFKDRYGKIKVTPKEIIKEKLRRSPDKGDSLMLTFCPIPEDEGSELYVSQYI